MLRGVFFDATGTLIRPAEPVGHTYARIARRFGVAVDENAVAAAFRRAFSYAGAIAFGPGIEPSRLRELERQWWRDRVKESFAGLGMFADFEGFFSELFAYFAEPASWCAVDDALAAVAEVRRLGYLTGVISNFDYRLYGLLEGLGFGRLLDSVTISSEAGYAKPSPEIFRTALERHGLSADQAVHIGNSEELDFCGAIAAGIGAILIDPGRDADQAASSNRVARVRSLGAAIEVLNRPPFS
jgi:putative hydrolase of the HAD superfamily